MLLLNAYRDGELPPRDALDMERRLAADPQLRAVVDRLGRVSEAVRETFAAVPTPPGLRARVIREVGVAAAVPRRDRRPLAAALLVGLSVGGLAGNGAVYFGTAPDRGATAEAVLAAHLRGLAAPQPFDIASSSRHVVKPWFNGRTPVAPAAPDLADHAFPLAGGRIDIVGGTPVPTLVYRRDQHVISVTIVPGTGGATDGEERRDGSTIERWIAGDLTYWAVSDLNARDLRGFVDLFRARVAQER